MVNSMSAQPTESISLSLRSIIAGNVLALMGRNRVSQVKLAREIQMSQSSLSKRLSGDKDWESDDLERIAAYFGKQPADLLGSTIGYKSQTAGEPPDLTLIDGTSKAHRNGYTQSPLVASLP